MRYFELESLQKDWKGKVCLFGAGMIGMTWGYDLIRCAGFDIDFYADNKVEEGKIIRDNVKSISTKMLYEYGDGVLVFLTVSDKYQNSIISQLENNGVNNINVVDFMFQQEIIESVLGTKNAETIKRYKPLIDDREYLKGQFEYCLHYPLNYDKPKTFNEKIQWLKLNDHNPDYINMVDKYEVKRYVSDKAGEEFVIPTLGIYDYFEDIDFSQFPNKFVLKCTHDSGSIIICEDKMNFNYDEAKIILSKALKRNFYWGAREWSYRYVKPRIIVEQYMTDESGQELKDYKVFCFDGVAKLIQVDYDRFKSHKRNMYSLDWKYIPMTLKYDTDAERIIEKPSNLNKMIELAEKLSVGISHVRVDLYSVGEKIYFGELTFYHGCGWEKFTPLEWDYKMGEFIKL